MSEARSYIVHLLRKVEAACENGALRSQRLMIGKAVYRVSRAEDVREALQRLYCVRGFDRFALRLMWLFEHARGHTDRFETAAIEYDVEMLLACLAGRDSASGAAGQGAPIDVGAVESLETFHDQLHRFGKVLDSVRRRAFVGDVYQGLTEDALDSIRSEAELLERAALPAGQHDVGRFARACVDFLQYAQDHALSGDVRIINMLENANLTLQTVLAAKGTEEYDSLQKNIELLQNPRDLLG